MENCEIGYPSSIDKSLNLEKLGLDQGSKKVLNINIVENMSENNGYEAQVIATKGFFNKRVGSALLTSFDIDSDGNIQSAHLNVVETVKKYRGKGIGKSVVEAAIDLAQKRGIKKIELDSVDDAVGFYKRLGFKEVENGSGRMQMDLTNRVVKKVI
ncbi:MAG: GNAT family N-acetyltransferase [Candidatus Shapirobacteria bacterium]|jgi:ribosomal protein S18 acetylase RimI-like enzyme